MVVVFRDKQRAKRLYELLRPYAHINATSVLVFYDGSASRYLGELAQMLGNRQRATRHFEDALLMNPKLVRRVSLAMTRESYGRLLVREHSKGTAKRAYELFDAAQKTGRQLGIRWTTGSSGQLTALAVPHEVFVGPAQR